MSVSHNSRHKRFSKGLKSASLKWKWGSSELDDNRALTISCMVVTPFLDIKLSLWQAAFEKEDENQILKWW